MTNRRVFYGGDTARSLRGHDFGAAFYLGQKMSHLNSVIVLALQFAVTMDYALFFYHRYDHGVGS